VFRQIRNQTAAHAQKGDKCPLTARKQPLWSKFPPQSPDFAADAQLKAEVLDFNHFPHWPNFCLFTLLTQVENLSSANFLTP